MSLTELLPVVHALPRNEKSRLVQELVAALAQEENGATEAEVEYPVWSPYDAYEAAATLLQLLLEQDKREQDWAQEHDRSGALSFRGHQPRS